MRRVASRVCYELPLSGMYVQYVCAGRMYSTYVQDVCAVRMCSTVSDPYTFTSKHRYMYVQTNTCVHVHTQ